MSAIPFPSRQLVVRQVQTALGVLADGDDGPKTWRAITARLPLSPLPPIPSNFANRLSVTARVQRALGGIFVDGHDGQETWSALAQRFDPALSHFPAAAKPPAITVVSGSYPERQLTSPNKSGSVNERQGLVIHHASGYYEGTVSWCMTPGTNAGYHVLINTDGKRTVMGLDTARLYHSGESVWKGRSFCNAFMLGLAFIGNTNDGSMRGDAGRDLTRDEIASALEWIRPRAQRYGWTRDDITAHRLVSPGRKDDTSLRALDQIVTALFA